MARSAWQNLRQGLEGFLAARYRDRDEIARVLHHAEIPVTNRTDLAPLVVWHQIIRSVERVPAQLADLLLVVEYENPDDPLLVAALEAVDELDRAGPEDPAPPAPAERAAPGSGGDRAALLTWLATEWPRTGPCVCLVEGFPGVGKTHLSDQLVARAKDRKFIDVEIPEGQTSFHDLMLAVRQALLRGTDLSVPPGADILQFLRIALREPITIRIDDFQYCMDAHGDPLPELVEFFSTLKPARHQGRVLLLSARALNEEVPWHDKIEVRPLKALDTAEGGRLLTTFLRNLGRADEVPPERLDDVVEWLGGNPRAFKIFTSSLKAAPLDELIGAEPQAWELRHRRTSEALLKRLERELVKRTLLTVSDEGRDALMTLSVHRRSFKREALILADPRGRHEDILRELVDNFLLERRQSWYSLNPVAKEVGFAQISHDQQRARRAHRTAGEYYLRPFRAKSFNAPRNGADFIEVRHHLVLSNQVRALNKIAQDYALDLEKYYKRTSPIPSDPTALTETIVLFTAALSGGSPSPDLHYYLARLLLARDEGEDSVKASEELAAATALPSCVADIWLLHLKVIAELRGVAEIVATVEQAALSVPDTDIVTIAAEAAKLVVAKGGVDEGVALLLRAIETAGAGYDTTGLYGEAARLLAERADADEAISLLRKGIDAAGAEHDARSLYRDAARLLAERGDGDAAISLLRQGIDAAGAERDATGLYREAARLLAERGDGDAAISLLRQGIDAAGAERDATGLYREAARLLAERGDGDAAISLLRKGIDAAGAEHDAAGLHREAARLLRARGDDDEAIAVLRQGAEAAKNDYEATSLYREAARSLAQRGGREEAISLLRQGIAAVTVRAHAVDLHRDAARLLAHGDAAQVDDAVALLRRCIEISDHDHHSVTLLRDIARLLARRDGPDVAVDLLLHGVQDVTESHHAVGAYYDAAEILMEHRRFARATEVLTEAIARHADHPTVAMLYSARAGVLSKQGDFAAAVRFLIGASATLAHQHRERLHTHTMFLAHQLRDPAVSAEVAAMLADSGDELSRVLWETLAMQNQDRWADAARIAGDLRRAHGFNATLAGQEVFSLLCTGEHAEAVEIAANFTHREATAELANWLNATTLIVAGRPDLAHGFLAECLRRELTAAEKDNPLLWVQIWKVVPPGIQPHPAFYFPRLPRVLTGLDTDLVISAPPPAA
ncbi:tetratricopeptide repeat protein [Actinokineospora iranica]|uniref:Flp pilus assembly protein TadD, contains TPR repeats n=1 Tax=Actinokineospora iranica TaxID=1271860 RepID=A0A1G6Z2S6_9PSEU|nr:hypothetical protein [Actinokineospora iranica]SDD96920.1 Flp pilus assembly protein TadD, contains TPR repeats [Actinokineospora iranica]